MRWVLAFAAMVLSMTNQAAAQSPEPVKVMVLGTYHFANPGLDVVNIRSESVLTPRRQRELEAVADALAEFEPTRIVAEQQAEGPDFELRSYREFRPEMLTTEASERIQIGYRLARRLGHEAVYGFDEQPEDGEPNYFPLGAVRSFAEESGQTGKIEAIMVEVRRMTEALEKAQPDSSISELLQTQNHREELRRMHGMAYYGLLDIGDGDRQPGAELNGYWYMRNAKMFAKLMRIARPGDRVLVVVGGGHKYWLDHLVETTPGFELVDPMPYLKAAAGASESR